MKCNLYFEWDMDTLLTAEADDKDNQWAGKSLVGILSALVKQTLFPTSTFLNPDNTIFKTI